MVIELSNDCMTTLNNWLQQDSWHTTHALDKGNFRVFVGRYVIDHGYDLDEQALQNLIVEIAGIGDRPALKDIAWERVMLMSEILEFMRATGRS
ncbi:hypothetical protein [Plesiomonas sp. ZOR0011]|uniref:hypothetical protein n=1 Tax=Plesiomonas sp. ZOR0011 TaxID=1339230 RepID=UPI0006462009|nr:hypothetical protein [Plesiomonas sp. ZOR0011]